MSWTLTEAKNRLSEVLDRADTGEAQLITRRGKEFVLLRAEDYRSLTGETPTLLEHLMAIPRLEDGIPEMPKDFTPMRRLDANDDEAAA